jgi:hypothetical protein
MPLNRVPFRILKPMLITLQTTANMALVMSELRKGEIVGKTVAAHDSTLAMLNDNPTRKSIIVHAAFYYDLLNEWAVELATKSPDFCMQIQALREQVSWLGEIVDILTAKQGE